MVYGFLSSSMVWRYFLGFCYGEGADRWSIYLRGKDYNYNYN